MKQAALWVCAARNVTKVCPEGEASANGTYVEQAALDERSGLPRFVHSGGWTVRYMTLYEEGYWVCALAGLLAEEQHYMQRFDPLAPAPAVQCFFLVGG